MLATALDSPLDGDWAFSTGKWLRVLRRVERQGGDVLVPGSRPPIRHEHSPDRGAGGRCARRGHRARLAIGHGFGAAWSAIAAALFVTAFAVHRWLKDPPHRSVHKLELLPEPLASPLARLDVWRFALASLLLTIPQFAVFTFAAIFLMQMRQTGYDLVTATPTRRRRGPGVE